MHKDKRNVSNSANFKKNGKLGRSGSFWEDNIKTDLRKIGSERGDWIHLSQYCAVARSYEHIKNSFFGFHKNRKFPKQLYNYQLLKKC